MAIKRTKLDRAIKVFGLRLLKSELISKDEWVKWLGSVQWPTAPPTDPAKYIASRLVNDGKLTEWQAEKILAGKSKGFFVGNYCLLNRLGSGGMSSVYVGEHRLIGQRRAIKILPAKLKKKKSYLARFYQEGRVVAALRHPNIVRVYDLAEEHDHPFMVMEHIDGTDLQELVQTSGSLSEKLAIDCIIQAAQGLGHAHSQGLIHRDVKPANLMLTKQHQIKVLDLGLALLQTDSDQFGISAQHNETLMGTADYLAPEQAVNSHNIDHRADIYGLGCTLYYLLTARPPFTHATLAERINAHRHEAPPAVRNHRIDCSQQLIDACEKMLEKNPADRFQDCQQVVAFLKSKHSGSQKIAAPERVRHSKTRKKNHISKSLLNPLAIILLSSVALVIVLMVLLISSKHSVMDSNIADESSTAPSLFSTSDRNSTSGSYNTPLHIDFASEIANQVQKETPFYVGSQLAGSIKLDQLRDLQLDQNVGLAFRDTNRFEFRLADLENPTISNLQISVEKHGAGFSQLSIESKSSNRRAERWKSIANFDQFEAGKVQILSVSKADFENIDARKLRFRIDIRGEAVLTVRDITVYLK